MPIELWNAEIFVAAAGTPPGGSIPPDATKAATSTITEGTLPQTPFADDDDDDDDSGEAPPT